jgi:L-ascorbate metabolism protein UlaG (beta-lactamase superfamily)
MFNILLLCFCLSTWAKYPLSDHYNGDTFFNPGHHEMKSFWDVLKWKLTTEATPWPESVPHQHFPFPQYHPDLKAIVTFVNHATFLLRYDGLTVLTDPIFSQRASPVRFAGPKRVREPGVSLDQLPAIDVVMISHNHYDHLNLESLKHIDEKFHPLFLVPLGDEELLKKAGIQNVREMDWWEEQQVKEHTIVFTPAQHWSARGLFDKCKSLWGSFFIKSSKFKTYFAGDTGYGKHFKMIQERLGTPDLSLLPVGAYEPRYFMKFSHMNPEDAVLAHQDLQSTYTLGMHFGTFQLTDESIDEPVTKLKSMQVENFTALDFGESKIFP